MFQGDEVVDELVAELTDGVVLAGLLRVVEDVRLQFIGGSFCFQFVESGS